ncbi:MAG: hypothetical protein JXR76_09935 [Deltaproteobacteria bacterium]|nr:hypothetical protein [Deltaproteobacteria bacterium]
MNITTLFMIIGICLTFTCKLHAFNIDACPQFPVFYVDSRDDDTILPETLSDGKPSQTLKTVPGLEYVILDRTGLTDDDSDENALEVDSGTLDASGCITTFTAAITGNRYRLKVFHDFTNVGGSGFKTISYSKNLASGDYWRGASYYTWTAVQADVLLPVKFGSNDRSKLVPALYEIYSKNWVPDGHKVTVVSNSPDYEDCIAEDGSQAEGLYLEDGVAGETICLDEETGKYKYQIAHEAGHGFSMALNGFYHTSYEATRPGVASPGLNHFRTNPSCYPDEPDIVAGINHTMHSREFSGTAASEGIAHAISGATWRGLENPNNAIFVNYGDYWMGRDKDGNYGKVTDTYCKPPSERYQKLGCERDWMSFFWGLWTDADEQNQFSLNEMMSIWATLRAGDEEGEKSWCHYLYRYPSNAPDSLLDALPKERQEGWVCKDEAFVAPAVIYGFAQPPHGHAPFWYVAGITSTFEARDYYAGFNRDDLLEMVEVQGSPDKRTFFDRLGREVGVFYEY